MAPPPSANIWVTVGRTSRPNGGDYTAELSPGPLDIGFDYHFSVPANHGDLTGVYVENRFVYGLRSGRLPAGMKIAGPAADSDDYQPAYGAEDTEAGKGAGRILDLDAPRRKNDSQTPGYPSIFLSGVFGVFWIALDASFIPKKPLLHQLFHPQ